MILIGYFVDSIIYSYNLIHSISHLNRPGDIVSIAPSSDDDPNSQLASGVVSSVSQSAVSVACDESGDSETLDDSVQYRLIKQANDITYRRLKRYWAQFYKEFYDKS